MLDSCIRVPKVDGKWSRAGLRLSALGLVLCSASTPIHAQAREAVDHAVVFELGWEGDWSRGDGFNNGGTVALETTPVENWLELEFGVSVIQAAGGVETPVDLLFKKPWRLSPAVEFMAGVGPEVVHSTAEHATFWGVSAIADLMVWPHKNVGWYVEPAVDRTFKSGAHENGFGIAAGLIIGR